MSGTRTVAIIGAGPAGLVAARYLRSRGFECRIFEQSDSLGGQWNGTAAHSGVWPSMVTNTSRVMTRFSDLPYEPGVANYPLNRDVLAYLKRYAEMFGITDDIRTNTRVESVERRPSGRGYTVRSATNGRANGAEDFEYVVVSSGRYNTPETPKVEGLETFSGSGGITHSFRYKQPDRFRGLRVLVAGCSISALEISSDLAMLGARRVISTTRRPRYVVPKMVAGVPVDALAFTRFGALAAEVLPPEAVGANMKEFVLRIAGSPEQYGALKPSPNILEAGISLSHNFLPLVAEGRITTKPWITRISGQSVHFTDGSDEEVDAIILGTGYELSLPFLSEEIRRTLDQDAHHLDLHNFTFHPDLPGFAVIGLQHLIGPGYPVIELQARWIAYSWSGEVASPSREEMLEGVNRYRARRGMRQEQVMHVLALLFARAANVEPSVYAHPELARALLFGPLAPTCFRMDGPDALPNAPQLFAEDAATFGAITSPEFTPQERAQLDALQNAKRAASRTAA